VRLTTNLLSVRGVVFEKSSFKDIKSISKNRLKLSLWLITPSNPSDYFTYNLL
jgi:hypothetical protein